MTEGPKLCSWCWWRRRRDHDPDRRTVAEDPGGCPCECHRRDAAPDE